MNVLTGIADHAENDLHTSTVKEYTRNEFSLCQQRVLTTRRQGVFSASNEESLLQEAKDL